MLACLGFPSRCAQMPEPTEGERIRRRDLKPLDPPLPSALLFPLVHILAYWCNIMRPLVEMFELATDAQKLAVGTA